MSKKRDYSGSLFVTGADQLVALVKKRKTISISDTAKKLGVSEEVVEDWAYDIQMYSGTLFTEIKQGKKYLVIKK